MKLTLETDYKVNGNSTGCALDTLAIAVDGRDSNDIEFWEGDHYAVEYVVNEYDYESDMLKTASKAQLKAWIDAPDAQAEALKVYTEAAKESALNDDDSELAKEIQKARDDYADEQYKEWINGDHRNYDGILSMASKRYSEREIDFSTEKGDVYADIPDTTIAQWKYDGYITRKTQAKKYLEGSINSDARHEFEKRKAENEKRKVERERLAAYKAAQAAEAEIERKNKLQKLIEA